MMKRIFTTISVCLLLAVAASGQKPNWGLAHPQPAAEIPQGKAEVIWPAKKDAVLPQGAVLPEKGENGVYTFTGQGWELAPASVATAGGAALFGRQTATPGWYRATVPGTVLTTLVDCGVFPDPYIGLNNLAIPDTLCRRDWWYRTVFDVPATERGRVAELLFEGINYRAEMWLNGRMLGRVDGAFIRGRFDLDGVLKPEGNVLAVKIVPPPNP
ncbi:MAG: glycoside hydrolase family 2, partial [Rikenellaceae bacterium]|nr:glycoside hydrolase family 2 [Rikenellaceae bacterium]